MQGIRFEFELTRLKEGNGRVDCETGTHAESDMTHPKHVSPKSLANEAYLT